MASSLEILFKEEQQYRQRWIWILLLLSVTVVIVFMIYVMYQQLIRGNPVGNSPMPNDVLIWFGPFIIALMAALVFLFKILKLSVRIDPRFLHIRFFPFFKREIPVADIVKWQARQYRPILEYGGWGIRYWFGGKAYNISGNQGVQLEFLGGKKLLIGSRRADEFAAAIHEAKSLNRKS
jgi:hypothetical protein